MFRKIILLAVIGGLLSLGFHSTAFARTENDVKLEAKVRSGISKLGVGQNSIIKVKLQDNTKVKGYISEITDDYFSVTNKKTIEATKIEYSAVKQIKGKNNLSGKTIAAYAIIVAIITLIALRGNS